MARYHEYKGDLVTIRRILSARHRPMVGVTLSGLGLLVLGIVGLALLWPERGALGDDELAVVRVLRSVAINACVVGVVLCTYAALRSKGRSIEEAYRLGYDIGFENGYQSSEDSRHPKMETPGRATVIGLTGRSKVIG